MDAFKCGYCSWIISASCENVLEHSCFKNFNSDEHQLVADDNSTVTIVAQDGTVISPDEIGTTDVDEILITLVSQRKPLYDPSIKMSERTNFKKNALWMEVKHHMEDTMSVDEIKARWKYLRDCYIKARKKISEYTPSGAGAKSKSSKSGFRFYENMAFLNDTLERKNMVSSVSVVQPGTLSPSTSEIVENPQITIKRKKVEETKELHKAIVQVLSNEPKPVEGLDGFLLRIREGFGRLNYKERSKLEIKFLQLLQEAEEISLQ